MAVDAVLPVVLSLCNETRKTKTDWLCFSCKYGDDKDGTNAAFVELAVVTLERDMLQDDLRCVLRKSSARRTTNWSIFMANRTFDLREWGASQFRRA